jgi:hypothetical protein
MRFMRDKQSCNVDLTRDLCAIHLSHWEVAKQLKRLPLKEAASAVKYPAFIHFSYKGDSISDGENVEANSRLKT